MKSEDKKIKYSTLQRYFEDKSSELENQQVREWLENSEDKFKCEKSLHLLWSELEPGDLETEVDFEAILDKVHHTIHRKTGKMIKVRTLPIGKKSSINVNHVLRNLGRIAAIIILPLLAYNGWQIYDQKMWESSQTELVYNEIICPLGAKSQFVLPDGTTGSLNNGSRLKYPQKFTGDLREVELYGEAFFDVEHNRQRPFIINTVGLDVKVLGTRLNVYSYPDEGYQEVTLESGKVELIQRKEDQEYVVAKMKPGQHAVYRFGDKNGKLNPEAGEKELVEIQDVKQIENQVSRLIPGKQVVYRMAEGDLYLEKDDTEHYTGWTDGKLILRNDPMPVLLKRMERWYSVKFNIEDERINEYTYWATFEEENIDQVLSLLSLTGPVKFTKVPREKNPDGSFQVQEINVSIVK
jgi:ferric-dicitrate binding protein FerR (iron transport regulator)